MRHPAFPKLAFKPLLALTALSLLLGGCGDPIPGAPNGPKPEEAQVLRRTPNHKGKLGRVRDTLVLTTEGTPYEEGYEHGYLLRDEMQSFYADYFRGRLLAAFRWFPEFSYAWYAHAQARAYDPEEKDEIRGLVEGSGMSEDAVLEMQADPPWQGPATWFGSSVRPLFGSTAFYVMGPGTYGGISLIGSNQSGLDFNLRHRFAMLQVHHPSRGYAFVTPGFVGRVLDASAGWNEKGLCVTENQGTMRWENESGVGAGVLTRRIVEHCANLDDAETLARSIRNRAGQGLILMVATAQGARRIEMAQSVSDAWQGRDRIAVTSTGPKLSALEAGTTFHGDAMRAVMTADAGAIAREARFDAMLKDAFGRIDPSRAMELLTDSLDTKTGQNQASDRTVSLQTPPYFFNFGPWHAGDLGSITTFASVVRDLTHGMLYLAQGEEHIESPAQFDSFDFKQLLTGSASVPVPVPSLPPVPPATPSGTVASLFSHLLHG